MATWEAGPRDFLLRHRGALCLVWVLCQPPSPLQPLPVPVCCAVYGAIIHSEDNGALLSALWVAISLHCSLAWHGIEKSNGDQEPGALCSVLFTTREKIRGVGVGDQIFFFFSECEMHVFQNSKHTYDILI